MKIERLGLCRGVGKIYLKVRTARPFGGKALSVILTSDNREFPSNCYPFFDSVKGDSRETDCWVVEVPVLDTKSALLSFFADGEQVGASRINYALAKWGSRLNYRFKKKLCAEIRNYEEGFVSDRYQIKILSYFEGNKGDVWRCVASWKGDASARPILSVYDGKGAPVSAEQHFFEFQESIDGRDPHKLFVSVELPKDQRSFYIIASPSASQREMGSGFCAIGPEQFKGFKRGAWECMKDARADDRAYGRWFEQHRVCESDLEKQRSADFETNPLISIVVPCYESDGRFLREMIQSVVAQSYAKWEASVVCVTRG